MQVGKGHFRLNHPKFGGVARRVGVFGAEGRAKGVHAAKAHGQSFGLKLARNGQVALAAKKVGGHVLVAGLKAGDAKHLASALAVCPGKHRRVHPRKTTALKKLVHGLPGLGTDAEGRAVFVGARAQVGDGAQKFIGVTFFLQRKGFSIGKAEHSNAVRPDFPLLALAG